MPGLPRCAGSVMPQDTSMGGFLEFQSFVVFFLRNDFTVWGLEVLVLVKHPNENCWLRKSSIMFGKVFIALLL